MSSKKDKFKKQFQTNKINTVQKSDKRYNKKTSKSDKEYISGNYVSSVDKKIYGIKKNLAEGKPYVIRQKMPLTGTTSDVDEVYVKVEIDNTELQYHIMIKAD